MRSSPFFWALLGWVIAFLLPAHLVVGDRPAAAPASTATPVPVATDTCSSAFLPSPQSRFPANDAW